MKADAQKATDLFLGSNRYCVPAYQRPYVWTEERQWSPLWEDISRLADARLDGRMEIHFLGAIVVRLEGASTNSRATLWTVIDGQQRLTTLQLLIAALATAAEQDGVSDVAVLLEELVLLNERIAQGDERFRFWPTTVNQESFRAVMQKGGADSERADDPSNTIEEAWEFFRERAREYAGNLGGDASEYGNSPEEALSNRYGALYEAITGQLQLVAIQLDSGDPAQVIFETLNARGTPLLAIELVKNALLDKARREGHEIEDAHARHWEQELGDDDYWSAEERLGRGTATRAEAFLYYWMAMKLGELVPVDGLFDRFRREFVDSPQAPSGTDVMDELNADASLFRSLENSDTSTSAGRFIAVTRMVDTNVFHPVTMALERVDLNDEQRERAFAALGSYLVRRMVRGLQTRAYGAVAVSLADEVRRNPETADDAIVEFLLQAEGDTSRWPGDQELSTRLAEQPIYGWLGRGRLASLLAYVELAQRAAAKTEDITQLPKKLEIEHILPQSWQANWPLGPDATEEEILNRESHVHLIGNLTLITGSLNSTISNGAWDAKRAALAKHSILMLNKDLSEEDEWNESSIQARGERITDQILRLWPGPQSFTPDGWTEVGSESWPEHKMLDASEIAEVFNSGTPYLRALMADLARHPDERRMYSQIEKDLDWPTARLRGVFGGYTQRFPQFERRRPFAIHFDSNGQWWMWQTAEQAEHTLKVVEEHSEGITTMEGLRAWVAVPEVRELIDLAPAKFNALGEGWKGTVKPGSSFKLDSPNSGVSGYFAKKWLFLWVRDRFPGDVEWFGARLSKPDEVRVDAYGTLRMHVVNEADIEVVIEGLKLIENESEGSAANSAG